MSGGNGGNDRPSGAPGDSLIAVALSTFTLVGIGIAGLVITRQLGLFPDGGDRLFIYTAGFFVGYGACDLVNNVSRFRALLRESDGRRLSPAAVAVITLALVAMATSGVVINQLGLFGSIDGALLSHTVGSVFGFGACTFVHSLRRYLAD